MMFSCHFISVKYSFKSKNHEKCFLLFSFFSFFLFLPTLPMNQTHSLLKQKEIATEGRVSTSVVKKAPFQRWQQEANKGEALKRLFKDINSTKDSVHEQNALLYQHTSQITGKIMDPFHLAQRSLRYCLCKKTKQTTPF